MVGLGAARRRDDILSTNTSAATNAQTAATPVTTIFSTVIRAGDGFGDGPDTAAASGPSSRYRAAAARPAGVASHARNLASTGSGAEARTG
jgi:hypothetical protein